MALSPNSDSGSLIFITYDDTKTGRDHDQKTRKIVRKRAFNSSRPSFPLRRIRSPEANAPSARGKEIRFRLQKPTTADRKEKTQAVIPRPVSAFEHLGATLGKDSWRLLGFYHHAFRQNSLAINVEGDWLSFTMSDPAVIHAQLALVALTMDIDSATNKPFVHHTSASLRHIRKKLQQTKGEPDDQLLGAVALLLVGESLQSEESFSSPHFRALEAMLERRGGYDNFKGLASLQRVVSWARRAYLLRWHVLVKMPTSPYCLHSDESRLDELDAQVAQYRSLLPTDLLRVVAKLRTIDAYIGLPGRAKRTYVSDTIYDIERTMLLLDDGSIQGFEKLAGSSLTSLFRVATHIYLIVGLRQIHRKFPVVQKFVRELGKKLVDYHEQINDASVPDSESKLLLWIETMYCIAAVTSEAHKDSLRLIRSRIDDMAIWKWDHYRNGLSQVAFASTLDKDLFAIWATVKSGESAGKDRG